MSQHRVMRRFAIVGAMSLLAAVPVQAQPPEPTAFWISFPLGTIELHQADHESIRAVANYMKRDPVLFATIVGKTDTVGSAEYNERLSEKRAVAVFDDLVYGNQIPASRTHIHWTGEHLQNVPTADQQAELQNRVVVITLSLMH